MMVLGLALCALGCDSACENANEKIEDECQDEIARAQENQTVASLPLGGGTEECTEDEECIAKCINQTDCDSLAFVMWTGVQRDPNVSVPEGVGPFRACLHECDPRL
jgi:hypothetical protein